jgi:transposase
MDWASELDFTHSSGITKRVDKAIDQRSWDFHPVGLQGRDKKNTHGSISICTQGIFCPCRRPPSQWEFIGLLKKIDAHYPPEAVIRVVLDNHSAHISRETMAYLGTRPGRFEYMHTPKHGSWLNLIECVFSKMARTFLRHIRVKSKDELKTRILKGIAEINASPVVFRWNKFDFGGV